MFDFLQGRVEALGTGTATLRTGGIGWAVQISSRSAARLREGQRARLYLHLAVSDSALALFAFADETERSFFRRLLQVSGVGPASALALLGALSPQEIATAITENDPDRLRAAKGIGKKTAQRLVLELKDKLEAEGLHLGGAAGDSAALERVLAGLGFRPAEARDRAAAARRAAGPSADFQALLRAALKEESPTS